MPELDVDLVRILALAMLGVIILVLLLVLSSLTRIRKDLSQALDVRRGGVQPEASSVPAATAAHEAAVAPAAASTEAVPAQAQVQQAEAAAAVSAASPARIAAQPQEQAAAEPVAAEEPLAEPEPEPEPEPVAVEPVAAEPLAEEPQEQPFERDGRWWFRRGDELLVYDEATGQWVASPHEAAPAAAPQPAGAMATTISGISGASQVSQSREPAAASEPEAAGFWKCPSCGAVNGSTATSCRMCFAARP